MIELSSGIKIPILRACIVADTPGKIEGRNPKSVVKSKAYTLPMHGTDITKPRMTEGNTNINDCVRIMPTKPRLFRPTSLITPTSYVLVSIDIKRSE